MRKYILLLIAGFFIMACEKDVQCPADDFVGTYMGDVDCNLGINSMDGEKVFVSKLNERTLQIEIQGETLEVKIDGCELDVKDDVRFGTGVDGSATIIGDSLIVNYIVKAASIITEDCDFVGVKI